MASAAEIIYTATTTTTTTTTTTAVVPPTWDLVTQKLADNFVYYLDGLDNLPGGQIILRYIKSSYKNDPVRSLFELALFIFALNYFLSSKRRENKSEFVKFSNKEIDELVDEWVPEPLIDDINPYEKWQLDAVPEVKGHNGSHINIDGRQQVINLASNDFLNLNENSTVKEVAAQVINTDGVGACGPPNFYGTQDVHVRLEEDLARYLDGEQSILYGQDFVTAGSVIPAFLKRGDLCVVDSGVNLAIQKGLILSRCDIEWYDHNDMIHLEQILSEIKPVLDRQKPIKRRFIITEALFANSGDLANLKTIVELKNQYKYRLFLDESLSIGTLGKTGKGLVEHCNIPRVEVSISIGTMANSFASSGGFCVGVTPMIHHQRIQSIAYVFSASLPPYSAKVVSQAIKEINDNRNAEGESIIIKSLHDKTSYVHKGLSKILKTSNYFEIVSDINSPIVHLSLKSKYREQLELPKIYGNSELLIKGKPAKYLNPFNDYYNFESFLLQKVIDFILQNSNILITRSKNLVEHENLPVLNPHLLIHINNGVNQSDYQKLLDVFDLAINKVLNPINNENDLFELTNEILNY
ncbi:serine palmitoyltransferase component [Scheffersomyces coipomensis]|uniref:serine palmitoyltransferase component n=1 Tax=Scheffersomyces coipomensis TaxID=1788519 RepID=UPI00315C7A84